MLQGSKDTQMTLLKLFDRHIEEVKSRVGIDISHRTLQTIFIPVTVLQNS